MTYVSIFSIHVLKVFISVSLKYASGMFFRDLERKLVMINSAVKINLKIYLITLD